jgi:hypothetical protein
MNQSLWNEMSGSRGLSLLCTRRTLVRHPASLSIPIFWEVLEKESSVRLSSRGSQLIAAGGWTRDDSRLHGQPSIAGRDEPITGWVLTP